MEERKDVFFVSDVHLGLRTGDPDEREARFVRFLQAVPADSTKAVCLLGDIWDFWYEYRDVIPRIGARVVAELIRLMNAGVEVYFCPGNHDIWTFSFFESIGIHKIEQPYHMRFGEVDFCLGHGDCLGGAKWSYRLMLKIFHSRVAQKLFSTLHPWLAYRFGLGWSNDNRSRHKEYHFSGEGAPLYRFAVEESERTHVDCFVFGHLHDSVDMMLPTGARLVVLKDWMDGGMPCCHFDGKEVTVTSF